MLICDSCERREDVRKTTAVLQVYSSEGPKAETPMFILADLCICCRNRLTTLAKEAVQPQPRCVDVKRGD